MKRFLKEKWENIGFALDKNKFSAIIYIGVKCKEEHNE